jgi:feruloyl-CoA synthase
MPRFAPPQIASTRSSDGVIHLTSRVPFEPSGHMIGDWLESWAHRTPDAPFLTEQAPVGRRVVTYGDANAAVHALGRGLEKLGASPTRPVMILSDNSVDHALIMLAAMHIGSPAAPVSPAYSLQSRDFVKLREVAAVIDPAVIYVSDEEQFAPALKALDRGSTVVASATRSGGSATSFRQVLASGTRLRDDEGEYRVSPSTVAKILFTSGSTGRPKGIVNTQRMLVSNQEAIALVWPFLADHPPVVVDWLPWSHTFGANHNFNMVLKHGGVLHIDSGRPAPGRIEETVRLLSSVSPTLYFNVPRGFEALLPFLESNERLAERFFAKLDLLFYAAAALPQSLWERLERVAGKYREGGVPFVSAWGSTETSPLVTSVHFPITRAGNIGVPVPGCELRLVPDEDKLEIRVRGPNVTPGAWNPGAQITPAALDEHGYLRTGDAGKLALDHEPEQGVVFDGRTAENFKLTSGTWVSVGELRVRLVTACSPHVSDLVVAGHDRDALGVLLFLTAGAEALVREDLLAKLTRHNQEHPGNSTRITRALVLEDPASIDRGEITDKGYLNQRAILSHRANQVEELFAEVPSARVILIP